MTTIESDKTATLASIHDPPSIDLAKHLEWQFGEGQPLDGAIVFELARRAVAAEQSSTPATF